MAVRLWFGASMLQARTPRGCLLGVPPPQSHAEQGLPVEPRRSPGGAPAERAGSRWSRRCAQGVAAAGLPGLGAPDHADAGPADGSLCAKANR